MLLSTMCISLYQHQWAQWVLVCISIYCIRAIGNIIFNGIDVDNRWSRYFYYYQKFFVIVCLLPNILSWLYLLIVFRKFWNWGSLCSYGNHGTDRGGVLEWKWEDGWEVHELCPEREQGTQFFVWYFPWYIQTNRWVSMNKFILDENNYFLYERVLKNHQLWRFENSISWLSSCKYYFF